MASRRRGFVLVTRPKDEARRTIAALARAGWRGVSGPVLTVESLATSRPTGPTPDLVLFTSGNAVLSAAQSGALQRWSNTPFFTVGDRTAALADNLGASNVESAQGDASALATLCEKRFTSPSAILHVTGEGLGLSLTKRLEGLGHRVTRWETYRTAQAERFSPQIRWILGRRRVAATLLMSPRSAYAYANLITKHQLWPSVGDVKLVCISVATAQALLDSSPVNQLLNVCTAQKPSLGGVIDALSLEA